MGTCNIPSTAPLIAKPGSVDNYHAEKTKIGETFGPDNPVLWPFFVFVLLADLIRLDWKQAVAIKNLLWGCFERSPKSFEDLINVNSISFDLVEASVNGQRVVIYSPLPSFISFCTKTSVCSHRPGQHRGRSTPQSR